MAYTQTDLDTISRAIASGAKIVRFSDGRSAEYQTTSEMLQAKADIEGELLKNSSTPIVRQIRIISRSGW